MEEKRVVKWRNEVRTKVHSNDGGVIVNDGVVTKNINPFLYCCKQECTKVYIVIEKNLALDLKRVSHAFCFLSLSRSRSCNTLRNTNSAQLIC